jgi:hypothetical protein
LSKLAAFLVYISSQHQALPFKVFCLFVLVVVGFELSLQVSGLSLQPYPQPFFQEI